MTLPVPWGRTLLAAVIDLPPGVTEDLLNRLEASAPVEEEGAVRRPLRATSHRAYFVLTAVSLDDCGLPVSERVREDAALLIPCTGPSGEGAVAVQTWTSSEPGGGAARWSPGPPQPAVIEQPRFPAAARRFAWPPPGDLSGRVCAGSEPAFGMVIHGLLPVSLDDTLLAGLHPLYGLESEQVLVARPQPERVASCFSGWAEIEIGASVATRLGFEPAGGLPVLRYGAGYLADLGGFDSGFQPLVGRRPAGSR